MTNDARTDSLDRLSRAMAEIAGRAYKHQDAWSARAFRDTLARPHALWVFRDGCFVLGQVICDDAEILALATDPARHRTGLGRGMLARFEAEAQERGAARILLEVAADNAPARAFYAASDYAETGRRRAYYRRTTGPAADAVLMGKALVDPRPETQRRAATTRAETG